MSSTVQQPVTSFKDNNYQANAHTGSHNKYFRENVDHTSVFNFFSELPLFREKRLELQLHNLSCFADKFKNLDSYLRVIVSIEKLIQENKAKSFDIKFELNKSSEMSLVLSFDDNSKIHCLENHQFGFVSRPEYFVIDSMKDYFIKTTSITDRNKVLLASIILMKSNNKILCMSAFSFIKSCIYKHTKNYEYFDRAFKCFEKTPNSPDQPSKLVFYFGDMEETSIRSRNGIASSDLDPTNMNVNFLDIAPEIRDDYSQKREDDCSFVSEADSAHKSTDDYSFMNTTDSLNKSGADCSFVSRAESSFEVVSATSDRFIFEKSGKTTLPMSFNFLRN